jgi:hypothetical protein
VKLNPKAAAELHKTAQKNITARWDFYEQMAQMSYGNGEKQ